MAWELADAGKFIIMPSKTTHSIERENNEQANRFKIENIIERKPPGNGHVRY